VVYRVSLGEERNTLNCLREANGLMSGVTRLPYRCVARAQNYNAGGNFMLRVTSILEGCSIQAKDGKVGSANDILFDDQTWKICWLVVDTGGWLGGRKVLIHPTSIGETDGRLDRLYVELTKQQITNSPSILKDPPVSRQMDETFSGSYIWDSIGGDQGFASASMASTTMLPSPFGTAELDGQPHFYQRSEDQDPHLQSAHAVTGYRIHAVDGEIGHLQDFLVDDESWEIRHLIIDTRNWLPGPHVLLKPGTVVAIDWLSQQIVLNLTREQVSNSPPAWHAEVKISLD